MNLFVGKNITLGLDFDNTLINYNDIFYKLATSKGLIPNSIASDKLSIRNYLRSKGKDSDFTILQAEAYGPGIINAKSQPGAILVLAKLRKKGLDMKIISHKTKNPYKGPAYDLHEWALHWMKEQGFFEKNLLDFKHDEIFFEKTKEEKKNRIINCGCTHYIDDLPEILETLPSTISRIHYCPDGNSEWTGGPVITKWQELQSSINDLNV